MKILFWGTPDFAVPSFEALLGEGHDVVGVVTQPDRPAGRGLELRGPPIKAVARDEMVPIYQPESARDPHFIGLLKELGPDISVVIAYGQILRKEVLDIPQHGSINAHASLLPELRGAAPINWALARGYDKTGVTIMRMVEKMDAGPIIHQVEEPIGADETFSDLWLRLSEISAEALVESLAMIESGAAAEREQDEARATYAPRITRDHARIDWTLGATTISNLIRAMDAVPGAWTTHRDAELKVFRPAVVAANSDAAPGSIVDASGVDPEAGIVVTCGDGALAIREVQPAGKRRMTASEWLRGRAATAGERLGSSAR
jgi:methionyl-tRNA formyltransferase